MRRTWNAFAPTMAPAMFSRTYAFIPWMIATTATRNATDTMMPSSVKNERSLFARICPRAIVEDVDESHDVGEYVRVGETESSRRIIVL